MLFSVVVANERREGRRIYVDPMSLELLADGTPSQAWRVLSLDDWHDADVAAAAQAADSARTGLPLSIGIATRQPPERLRPLWEALTLTVVGPEVVVPDRCFVPVADPEAAVAEVSGMVERGPRACVALGRLLRQTPQLNTLDGLAAEAAVYSMLLGGPEFANWLARRGAPRTPLAVERSLVQLHRDGDRLVVVLDHSQRRNAFSAGMREALFEALEMAVLDTGIKVVELSGTGPVFCSGGDLAEFGTATDLVAAYLVRLERAPWRLIDRIAERVTVRIQGAAVGAGIEMAAFAGRVVAAPGTFCQLPEADMGLVPGAGGTVSITRRIGRWRTAWMVLSGARIDTGTALEWGLVDEVDRP